MQRRLPDQGNLIGDLIMMQAHTNVYYVPKPSIWPIVGSIALFCIMLGTANWLHQVTIGPYFVLLGVAIFVFMLFGWFGTVIHESMTGAYNKQVDRSFRWGMGWFIFTEVMFFACLFGVLFYARIFSVPWLGGVGVGELTNYMLWPDFSAVWPLIKNPDPNLFSNPKLAMEAWGIPALNTILLLSSGGTITWAHWALIKGKRTQLNISMLCTILLGISFLIGQVFEYHEAYTDLQLTLDSGIYGTTFYSLTGFHGLHVTIGTIMLIVIWVRCLKGHFDKEHLFAFEAVSWYWHFVDVVWLFLFIFVYWF